MAVNLLETINYKNLEELQTLALPDNSEIQRKMREKYPDKRLTFQTVMHHNSGKYCLNVFEFV